MIKDKKGTKKQEDEEEYDNHQLFTPYVVYWSVTDMDNPKIWRRYVLWRFFQAIFLTYNMAHPDEYWQAIEPAYNMVYGGV